MLLIVFAPAIVPPFLQAWVTLLSEVYSWFKMQLVDILQGQKCESTLPQFYPVLIGSLSLFFVFFRIDFKMLFLIFKFLYGLAHPPPIYLSF